jgi:predicted PurR-regulated permease PerM
MPSPLPNAGADQGRSSSRLTVAFFALGTLFFAFMVADRLIALAVGFSSLLLTIFLAWLLVFLVAPAVDVTQRRLGIGRGPAVGFVYLTVLACVGLLVAATALIGAGEATDIVARSDEITTRIHGLLASVQTALGISPSTIDLAAVFDQAQRALFSSITSGLNAEIQAIAGTTLAVLGSLFLVVILSLYAVLDFDGLLGGLRRIVPNRYAQELLLVQQSVGHAFGGFLRTQIILVILQALITIVVGVLFGLPYLYLITVSGALAMFVPFFGPPLALLPPVLVAVVFRPEVALPAIVVLVVGQTLLVNVLQPRLMKDRAGIHPIVVLIALLLGAQIAGIWGALFGIPIVAAASLLVRYAVNRRAVEEVEGIDLDDVVAEMQAADPELPLYEAVSIAADRAEALTQDRSEPPAAGSSTADASEAAPAELGD